LGRNSRNLPWRRINRFILKAQRAGTPEELDHVVLKEIEGLIPHRAWAACMRIDRDGAFCQATTAERGVQKDFNDYYHQCLPLQRDTLHRLPSVDWRPLEHTEYVRDFVRPAGVRYSACSAKPPYAVVIQRGPDEPPFNATELSALEIVSEHLRCIHHRLHYTAGLEQDRLWAAEAVGTGYLLSRREREIARLLFRRMSAVEIAKVLGISPNTVYRHSANIYEKLGIRYRWELFERVFGHKPWTVSGESDRDLHRVARKHDHL
jgi:DNA-binding CsgD family transcriptional regulator